VQGFKGLEGLQGKVEAASMDQGKRVLMEGFKGPEGLQGKVEVASID